MKIYKVTQRSANIFSKNTSTIFESYYDSFKKAKTEYYKMKKHYLSCKPTSISENKTFRGCLANCWSIKMIDDGIEYTTAITEIEVQ